MFNSVFNTDMRCSVDGRKRYENNAKTIIVDGNRFENGAKQYRFQLKTVYCGRGLKVVLHNRTFRATFRDKWQHLSYPISTHPKDHNKQNESVSGKALRQKSAVTLLHEPTFSKFVILRTKFLKPFQKLATRCRAKHCAKSRKL